MEQTQAAEKKLTQRAAITTYLRHMKGVIEIIKATKTLPNRDVSVGPASMPITLKNKNETRINLEAMRAEFNNIHLLGQIVGAFRINRDSIYEASPDITLENRSYIRLASAAHNLWRFYLIANMYPEVPYFLYDRQEGRNDIMMQEYRDHMAKAGIVLSEDEKSVSSIFDAAARRWDMLEETAKQKSAMYDIYNGSLHYVKDQYSGAETNPVRIPPQLVVFEHYIDTYLERLNSGEHVDFSDFTPPDLFWSDDFETGPWAYRDRIAQLVPASA